MARSTDRQQYLVDLLSTAVETGVSHWAETIHVEDGNGTTPDGDNLDPLGSGGHCHAAIVRDLGTGDELHIDLATIGRGVQALAARTESHDLPDVEEDAADLAVQYGLFGRIRR